MLQQAHKSPAPNFPRSHGVITHTGPDMLRSVAFMAALLSLPAFAGLTPEQRSRNVESFDYVWKTIRDKHWSMPFGLDWDKVRDELRPKVEAAASTNQARSAMLDMIGRLK